MTPNMIMENRGALFSSESAPTRSVLSIIKILPILPIIAMLSIVSILVIAFAVPAAYGQSEYYADVSAILEPDGSAAISGASNHPLLSPRNTYDFTSKKGQYWLFNISTAEPFSDFIFKVALPENSVINYVKAPSQVRISEENRRLTITGTGNDEPFSVQIQYYIGGSSEDWTFSWALFLSGAAIFILVIIIITVLLHRRARGTGQGKKPEHAKEPAYNPDTLTERQKQILDIIKASNTVVTQAMIEREIKIPKSSISRNIDSLAKRGIIKKERRGMSNILTLLK